VGNVHYNTYAEVVKSRAFKAQRTQSLTKINDLGVGIIYNWDYIMSYSESLNDYGLKPPSQMNGGESSSTESNKDGTLTRYKARFMYVGLSVQLPTSRRISKHLEDTVKEKDVFHTSLRQALRGTYTNNKYDTFRNISSPGTRIPEIVNICSFFDLGGLESYYIEKGPNGKGGALNQLKQYQNDFPKLMEAAATSGKTISGVNTASGDQGGPLRQSIMQRRGVAEWVMAAYFALYENQDEVIASRKSGFDADIRKLRTNEMTLAEKVIGVFKAAINNGMVSSSNAEWFNRIQLHQVQNTLELFGLSQKGPKQLISGEMKTSNEINSPEINRVLSYISYDARQFSVEDVSSAKDGLIIAEKRYEIISKNIDTKLDTKKPNFLSIKADLTSASKDLQKTLKIKMGAALIDEVRKLKKPVSEALTKIQMSRVGVQAPELIEDLFEEQINDILSNIQKQFEKTMDVTSIDIDIVKDNRALIQEIKIKASKEMSKALDDIYSLLARAIAKSTITGPRPSGRKPNK
jgi:hypothetical protein